MPDLPKGWSVEGEGPPEGWSVETMPAPATAEPQTMSMGEVGMQAVRNLPSSAAQFAQDVVTPIFRPVETIGNLGDLIIGSVQKMIPGVQSREGYADAVGQFFADRYGGMENIKRTMANDPVGFMADVSTVLTGGGAAAARAPGMVGQAGRAVQRAGAVVDPLQAVGRSVAPIAAPVGRLAGRGLATAIGDLGTHTGGESIARAARAGFEGGSQGQAFRESMRGQIPMETVVSDAMSALDNIRQGRGRAYREGMQNISRDQTVLDFAPIDRQLVQAGRIKRFKGEPIGRATETTDRIMGLVNRWKSLDPAEFHTPEGLDALKQGIGEIRDATRRGSPEDAIATRAYNAVKDQIVQQAPEYADVMRGYWEASDLIKEMQRTLSLNPNAQVDTQLRKLQSLMRNNANTNYGRRLVLGEMLQEAGADTLMSKLAGQALEPIAPRGLGRVVAGGAALGGMAVDPTLFGAMAVQSPRVMGEAAYGAGRLAEAARRLPPSTGLGLFQAGRLSE